jgi:hypothetical protein
MSPPGNWLSLRFQDTPRTQSTAHLLLPSHSQRRSALD